MKEYYDFANNPKKPKNIAIVVLLVVLLLAFGVVGGYYYATNNKVVPNTTSQTDDQLLLSKLALLMELPQSESPTFATVNDADKLKDQLFFKNAKNGDKIVAFPISKFAVLYRPSTEKIVWIGPMLDNTATTPTVKPTTTLIQQ